MRKQFLSYISDPLTHQPVTLEILKEEGGQVVAGLLLSGKSWYPIINGVPRMLTKELKQNLLQNHHTFLKEWQAKLPKEIVTEWQAAIDQIEDFDRFLVHQKKTAESFAYEWKYIYKENDYEKNNFFHFLSPYIKEEELKNKITVDIGCGSGRFTKQAALAGTKVSFGTDLGESVEVAYALNKDLENVCIIQADIYAMPFKEKIDIAYSIGVLHHLPQPEQGFASLPKVLKKKGKMLIWVYNRRNNGRAIYFYEPLRSVFKHIPQPILFKLCYIPGAGVHLINQVTHALNALGAKKLAKKVPFSYYANFPFNMKLNDAFDVLATPKSNYYYVEEIRGWFDRAQLTEIEAYEHPEAGITCVGLYEA